MRREYLIELAQSMGGVVTHTTPHTVGFVLEGDRFTMHVRDNDVILTQQSGQSRGQKAVIRGVWQERVLAEAKRLRIAR